MNNHRDPLTLRYRRSVAETIRDPWAYSEGPQEPQHIDLCGYSVESAGHRLAFAVCIVGLCWLVTALILGWV